MVDQEIGPVEVPVAREQHWTDFEITPQSLTFALAMAITIGTLLGYYV